MKHQPVHSLQHSAYPHQPFVDTVYGQYYPGRVFEISVPAVGKVEFTATVPELQFRYGVVFSEDLQAVSGETRGDTFYSHHPILITLLLVITGLVFVQREYQTLPIDATELFILLTDPL